MLLFSVQNANEDTIKKVAFKFISERELMQAPYVQLKEPCVRLFATKRRAENALSLRKEIVEYVKEQIDNFVGRLGLSFT